MRIEDIDTPRVVPGAESQIVEDLAWLGITFDESPSAGGRTSPYRQSERLPLYEKAIEVLVQAGYVYLCDCSRADIARVASAPHVGDEGPHYPGTCRSFGMSQRPFKRAPSWRLRVPPGAIRFRDGACGDVEVDGDTIGDFVLRRGDGVFAYQLATLVDDLTMGITEVVRGRDLLSSAPRQALLARLLRNQAPVYTHVPLLTGPDGERLAKRSHGITVADQRASGIDARRLVRAISAAYGHTLTSHGDPLAELAKKFDAARFPGESVDVRLVTHFAEG